MSISNITHPNDRHLYCGDLDTTGNINLNKVGGSDINCVADLQFNINSVPVFKITETGASHIVETDYEVQSLAVIGTTDATSKTDINASIHTLGGVAVEKSIYTLNLDVDGTTQLDGTTITTTDANLVVNGTGITDIQTNTQTSGILSVTNTTDSSAYTNGSCVVSGGLGVAKKMFINDEISTPSLLTTKLNSKWQVFNNALSYNTASGEIDVSNVSLIYLGSSVETITGFLNGVANQIVHLVKTSSSNTITISHNNGTGTQKIFTSIERDQTIVQYGAMSLIYSGSIWFSLSIESNNGMSYNGLKLYKDTPDIIGTGKDVSSNYQLYLQGSATGSCSGIGFTASSTIFDSVCKAFVFMREQGTTPKHADLYLGCYNSTEAVTNTIMRIWGQYKCVECVSTTDATTSASYSSLKVNGGISCGMKCYIGTNCIIGGMLDVNGSTLLDQVSIDTTDGDFVVTGPNQITMSTTANETDAISLTTNGGISETIVIRNTLGTSTSAVLIESVAGNITLSSADTIVSGYLSVTNNINCTASCNVNGTTDSTSTTTGSFTCDGGCGIVKNLYVGGTTYSTAGGTWTTISDRKFKENITDLDGHKSLERVMKLNPVSYNYNLLWTQTFGKKFDKRSVYGLIAQDVQEVYSEFDEKSNPARNIVENTYMTLKLDTIYLDMLGAIQELYKMKNSNNSVCNECVKLRNENDALKIDVEKIKKYIKGLSNRINTLEKSSDDVFI